MYESKSAGFNRELEWFQNERILTASLRPCFSCVHHGLMDSGDSEAFGESDEASYPSEDMFILLSVHTAQAGMWISQIWEMGK